MANLVVRNINDSVVKALKARAGMHGVSAEAEHRKILELVLMKPRKKSFSEVLLSMPNVGDDLDFAREQDERAENVFRNENLIICALTTVYIPELEICTSSV